MWFRCNLIPRVSLLPGNEVDFAARVFLEFKSKMTEDCWDLKFSFRRNEDAKHLTCFLRENAVFKFFQGAEEGEIFEKRSPNRRNLETPAFRFMWTKKIFTITAEIQARLLANF